MVFGLNFLMHGYDLLALSLMVLCLALWRFENLFFLAIPLAFLFKLHLVPGFHNLQLTSNFWLNLDSPLLGLFPLIHFQKLSNLLNRSQFYDSFVRPLPWILLVISSIAVLALSTQVVVFDPKIPSHFGLRLFANLFLTTIPEEAFFRGYIQHKLQTFFNNKWAGLVLSSLIFTVAHFFWYPTWSLLAFVGVVSVVYGAIYLVTQRLESAIFCHFSFNVIHMTLFSYHAV
jgi:membrane protease YdiL (CAAX protease family)